MEAIPDDILYFIFSFLDAPTLFRVCRVNKRWNQIGQHGSVWKGKWFPIHGLNQKPLPRLCHATVICRNAVYIFGGDAPSLSTSLIGTIMRDIKRYDFERKCWETVFITGYDRPATEHSSFVYENHIYIFGGVTETQTRRNVVCRINLDKKSLEKIICSGQIPDPGSCHACVLQNDKLYVHGGWNPSSQHFRSRLHILDLKNNVWTVAAEKGEIPHPRRSHKIMIHNDYLYLFGGYSTKPENTLFRMNLNTEAWESVSTMGDIPSPRSRFAMVKQNNALYVLGGWNGNDFLDDMYMLNLDNLKWTRMSFRFPRRIGYHSMVLHQNMIIVFGGSDGDSAYNDFFGLVVGDRHT